MSYILEALKKAQAERQLGETPGIHTPTLDVPAGAGAPLRKPLVAAVAVMGVVIVALAAVVWRQAAPAQPVQPAAAAATPAQRVQPAVATAAPAQAAQPAAVPVQAAQPPVDAMPAQPPQPSQPVRQATPAPPAVAKAPEPPARVAAAPAKAEEPAGEEPVQALRDLPEPIRRAVPPVAMSGYMYSPNPADRLILIDKVLRREGDEVAPGLVLERLEPKGAVFTFRGYRFRMPY
jgi:general secretion pathway protein B